MHGLAENSWKTRSTQWKSYLNFCEATGSSPLPANTTQICRYIVFLSDTLKYVSVINYISAVSLLHKLYGYDRSFMDDYKVKFTLAGLRRVLGDDPPSRPTLHIQDLLAMYRHVQLQDRSERTLWACIFLGFRSLLRKSNLVMSSNTDHHVIRRSAVKFFPWGMLLTISSTKTIQYGQRVITIPITYAHGSPICAVQWVQRHILDFPSQDPDSPLFLLPRNAASVPMTYSVLLTYLKRLLQRSGRNSEQFGLHSLRRAGASYMHSIGLTLEDIRQAGDWKSLAALIYLARPLQGRIETDKRVAHSLCSLSITY